MNIQKSPAAEPMSDGVTMTPLKRAFMALEETRGKLAAVQAAAREPIAIIGLGCRVPGADSPEEFWQLMEGRVDAIDRIPTSRWDADAFYDPDPSTPGRIATRHGGFLRSVDQFDPTFFGISPREAEGMDPQQRLLLEVAWEALEHAGQAPDSLERSSTGVFIGSSGSDYTYLQLKTHDPALLDSHFASGIAHSIISGRLSYILGLQGPSVTYDTACSSSLVAIHQACAALRNGDCRMALAGGVNLILSPDLFIALSHSRMLAPDGHCKVFDARADGFARGEGCGVVVLKRLSDAEAHGDRILAIIRGSAVNQDGPSSGLTAPNGPQQAAVIREAQSRAGVTPEQVGYIETHGTGTQLGDPLEVQALGEVFANRDSAQPLVIASVKTNVGHLEAAAGVTGLIKLVLALEHKVIPAHLHFSTPSSHIPWAELPFSVPTEAMEWKPIDGRRIGGVSSFGFSGTNAHLIVEEAPAHPYPEEIEGRASLLTLSARNNTALMQLADRLATKLESFSDQELPAICHTANAGRAHFAHRATIVAKSITEARSALVALSRDEEIAGLRRSQVSRRDPPRIAFLFTGQGSQYAGMTQGLYEASPVFRAALDRCAEILAPELERPLLDVLFSPVTGRSLLDETAYTQPALFAVEYALAELWRSFGVTPNVVMGHSVGEYVAACIAGVFSLEDGLKLIARRGRLMHALPAGGAMAAIAASEHGVLKAIRDCGGVVSIAAVNKPGQTVISGAGGDVAAVCARMSREGVSCQPLTVSHAFHSQLLDPVLDGLEREVGEVRLATPRLRLISNLTGRLADDHITQAQYWRQHAREAVRFADGLATLQTLKPDVIIEIGPQPTLLSFAGACLPDLAPALIPTLRKGVPDWTQMLDAVASAYLAGVKIDWRGIAGERPQRIVTLPTYPFQRERFWFRAAAHVPALPAADPKGHPLLGRRVASAISAVIHEASISADSPSFVRQHVVLDRVVLPATAYLDTLVAKARDAFASDVVTVDDVTIAEAMLLRDDGARRLVQTISEAASDGSFSVSISSREADAHTDETWTKHLTAKLSADEVTSLNARSLQERLSTCPEQANPADLYEGFARRGIAFGDAFHTVRQLWRGEGQAIGEVELDASLTNEAPRYWIHPTLLDGCLQVIAAALPPGVSDDTLYLPVGIGRLVARPTSGTRYWSHVTVRGKVGGSLQADIQASNDDGVVVAGFENVQLRPVSRDALNQHHQRSLDELFYETCWRPQAASSEAGAPNWNLTELAAAADGATGQLALDAGLQAYDAFLVKFEHLCIDFTLRAMKRLGWEPAAGEIVNVADLANTLGVLPNHMRLLSRLLDILAEANWLEQKGDHLRVRQSFPDVEPNRGYSDLLKDAPSGAAPELELTARVAMEMAEALRGERDPLQLLFPGGSLATAEAIYRESPTARFFNGMMAEVLAACGAVERQGRPLRILEVGAGTGGTTAHVLPRLSGRDIEYTFTDVGPAFVASARERFGQYPGARFQVLDLEKEPLEQGLQEHSFDIVIASNVIHATVDLKTTLRRLRSVTVPGGLLAMLEVTAPQRWFDLTVGLTPGWWAFQDTELRPDYPTLRRDQWLALLPQCGFREVSALPQQPATEGCLSLQSVFLARADTATSETGTWLLFADQSGIVAKLAEQLRSRGESCVLVHPGKFSMGTPEASVDPESAADYRSLLNGLRANGVGIGGVVHGWSIDEALTEATTADDLTHSQTVGAVSAMLLAQALVSESAPPRLWIVSRGGQQVDPDDAPLSPSQAPIWGFGKAVALEHPELHCTCVDLDPRAQDGDVALLLNELSESGVEGQVALRQGKRVVARLVRSTRQQKAFDNENVEPWRLIVAPAGAVERFRREPMKRKPPGPGEVEIAIEATGVNFKDVLNTLGLYPGNPGPLGGECAGRVAAVGPGVVGVKLGDDVIAVAGGSLASHVVTRAEFVQFRPDGVSADEGAAFPIAFLTAEFCLAHLAGMRVGDRVLIHAGAGGVGMAAVKLAQIAGAEVFATAGSAWKRQLLSDMGVKHIFDSRSPKFADEILAVTDGRGVDIILNSLAGEMIDASFRAIANGGRFVEIGKRGIKEPSWVDALNRDLKYFIVDWGEVAAEDPALIGGMLARLVDRWRAGEITSLPRQVFAGDRTDQAFRLMSQARHVGKIVVRHDEPKPIWVRRDGTYLITGGLSGLGLSVAQWLSNRGAGRLVLVGRRGVTPEAASAIEAMREAGCVIEARALDITDDEAAAELLQQVRVTGAPLRGVIHSAGVLDDAGLTQQSQERFQRVFGPKIRGAWTLDRLTRSDPLDLFVMFSSVAAVLGSAGQTNHSAANAFLDLLARDRRSRGLPGLSINWGPWSETGAAADRSLTERLATQGLGALTTQQGLAAMEQLLNDGAEQASVLPIDWNRFAMSASPGAAKSFLTEVLEQRKQTTSTPSRQIEIQPTTLLVQLDGVAPSRRRPTVIGFVRDQAARVLGVSTAIDPRMPLGDIGLDSLLSVELRNILSNAIGRPLSATLLFDYPTLDALSDYLLNEVLEFDGDEIEQGASIVPAPGVLESIEDLDDDEVDRLLAARTQQRAVR